MFRLPAGNLIASASAIGASCKFLQLGLHQARLNGEELILDIEQMKTIYEAAGLMRAASQQLGLVVCASAARDLGDCFERLPPPRQHGLMLNERQLGDLINGLEYLLRTFRDELDSRPLFAMPTASADLYDQPRPLFGEVVDDAFPGSAEDIAEAGRCMAVGRWTAAVMHLMRALEPPLDLLAAYVQVAPGTNWNKSLNEIEAKLRGISKRDHGVDEERWAAEAASHFRAFKNAWRNHAMHARSFYDQERATEIFEAVRALLRHLATKLPEAAQTAGAEG
ncbi:hypothetical protein [Methylobacterium sp. Leaf85]|uniref:hypothetical protein n=1 Tax=Methylobacterium sp. Leaf85 TaxID=1736241 RepID=UPI0006F6D586|nr:hypothetical protein [Methylobacterium sp. Leaf85]KQO49970.1 hypothetical protein ASF08_22815 [Methylobacterium sp. Leaf85]